MNHVDLSIFDNNLSTFTRIVLIRDIVVVWPNHTPYKKILPINLVKILCVVTWA